MRLGEYLRAPRPPWDWKQQDCCRWAARWVVMNGHANPMDHIGASYSTETGAFRLIAKGGGLVALWAMGMRGAGVREVESPREGDVAVIQIATDRGPPEACAIWTGTKWASLHKSGIMFGVGRPLKIWGVANG